MPSVESAVSRSEGEPRRSVMRLDGGAVIDVASGSTAKDDPAADLVVGRDWPRRPATGCVPRTVQRSASVGDARRAAILPLRRAVGDQVHREVVR